MIAPRGRRLAGWALAGAGAVALLAGAAALALAADRPPPVLILDLGQLPPAAPSIAAVAEAAPTVVSAPPLPEAPDDVIEKTALPAPIAPPEAAAATALSLPAPDVAVSTDIALPPPPDAPEPVPTRPRPRPDRLVDRALEEAEPVKKQPIRDKAPTTAKANAAAAGAEAASPATKARAGGTMSPAAYAKAVLKKVHATRKKPGAGRGTAVIGFTLAPDGALVSARVLQGSGSESLDQIALDHIRRSAPFPPAPDGAGRSFSFEFVGR
jgi:protein TonB